MGLDDGYFGRTKKLLEDEVSNSLEDELNNYHNLSHKDPLIRVLSGAGQENSYTGIQEQGLIEEPDANTQKSFWNEITTLSSLTEALYYISPILMIIPTGIAIMGIKQNNPELLQLGFGIDCAIMAFILMYKLLSD